MAKAAKKTVKAVKSVKAVKAVNAVKAVKAVKTPKARKVTKCSNCNGKKTMPVGKESLEDGIVPIIKTGAKVIIGVGLLGALGNAFNN